MDIDGIREDGTCAQWRLGNLRRSMIEVCLSVFCRTISELSPIVENGWDASGKCSSVGLNCLSKDNYSFGSWGPSLSSCSHQF